MSILPRSLSDQAFEVVRERILSTQIPPLAPIRQELLAEELGISKIPLREALSRLEEQGLEPGALGREEFAALLRADTERWGRVAAAARFERQ